MINGHIIVFAIYCYTQNYEADDEPDCLELIHLEEYIIILLLQLIRFIV